MGDIRTLITNENNSQWSDFIYWIINGLIYAEEIKINRENAADMPVTNLFGPTYKQMFRDVIYAVGNYGEIYERNLEEFIPRNGRNLLNTNPVGPQQLPLPFLGV